MAGRGGRRVEHAFTLMPAEFGEKGAKLARRDALVGKQRRHAADVTLIFVFQGNGRSGDRKGSHQLQSVLRLFVSSPRSTFLAKYFAMPLAEPAASKGANTKCCRRGSSLLRNRVSKVAVTWWAGNRSSRALEATSNWPAGSVR